MVFILGMPRSGTSLVEQILASHPDVYGAGELDEMRQIILGQQNTTILSEAFRMIPDNLAETINNVGRKYVQNIRNKTSSKAKFITDKMPQNFLYIGLIRMTLPNAKIIQCLRNPLDNCFSIYKNYLFEGHQYSFDLEELGEYYLLYHDLMRYWHKLFPGKIYTLSYENLVGDQENETRKLLGYCDLSWNDACLSFHKTERAITTASAAQVRRPIYKDSVKLWEKYKKQLEPLSEILKTIKTNGSQHH